jgi:hypothetical protein
LLRWLGESVHASSVERHPSRFPQAIRHSPAFAQVGEQSLPAQRLTFRRERAARRFPAFHILRREKSEWKPKD